MKLLVDSTATSDADIFIRIVDGIDEDIQIPPTAFRLSQRIIIDCSGVIHFSSVMLRAWMNWIRCFDPRQQFVFREVTQPLVNMINTVEGFLPPTTTIESFYLAYECEECGQEENHRMVRGKDFIEKTPSRPEKIHFPETLNCMKCKSVMKIAVLEQTYFQFLKKESINQ